MAKRRGFFAELQYQARLQEQRRLQAQKAAARELAAAEREAKRARQQWERAQRESVRRQAADAARKHREEVQLRIDMRNAEVAVLNSELRDKYEAIDSILVAALAVDDYVDLASLRQQVASPPFDRPDLTTPIAPPTPEPVPVEPVYVEPPPPNGLDGIFGGKQRHQREVAAARDHFDQLYRQWIRDMSLREERWRRITARYRDDEALRLQRLAEARQEYEEECQRRRKEALATNVKLERLMVGLQERSPDALQDYVGIVLSNSVYPECFPVTHEFEFDNDLGELAVNVTIPRPENLPSEAGFKYVKTSDSITSTLLPKKTTQERYAAAVANVTLRTAHEVFEADRSEIVQGMSITVGAKSIDRATGHDVFVPLAQLAADRHGFGQLNLERVDAKQALAHLRGGISKNPHKLEALTGLTGMRG